MFYIKVNGTFGACFVESELTATSIQEKAKVFDTEKDALDFRDKFWPLNEVSAYVKHKSQ